MARSTLATAFAVCAIVVVLVPHFTAQPSTADASIGRDRTLRQSALKAKKIVPVAPKWGFFGTIFHLILEQVNDTKSAYNQVNDLVSSMFVDDNAVTTEADPNNNGTTEAPKISRKEFLNILDRNLKGLARLRAIETREAKKESWANLQRYKQEIFAGKGKRKRR